jgi:hypothetical protein
MGASFVPVIALTLRHALTALGALGVMTGTQLEAIVGGVAVAAGLGWSWWSKKKK